MKRQKHRGETAVKEREAEIGVEGWSHKPRSPGRPEAGEGEAAALLGPPDPRLQPPESQDNAFLLF